jgi:cellobiose-specific phosphotransferase system component IIA
MKINSSIIKATVLGTLIVALTLIASIMVVPANTVSADSGTPTPKPGERANDALEKFYQRELKALAAQKDNIAKANDVLAKAQDYIDEQKADGKDVTKLTTILTKMKDQVARAQTSYDQAAKILNTHAGFDSNGQVTDAKQARDTINESRKALDNAHRILANITAEFKVILNQHRGNDDSKDNNPNNDKNKDKGKDKN